MASDPAASRPPSLASQVSKAVVWNTLFVPLRLLAEVLSTLVKLNRLSLASFGLLAMVSGASKMLGTGIDLGTTRALPKYIPETNRAGGALATLRLLQIVFAAQFGLLLLVAAGLALFQPLFLDYLRGLVTGEQRLDEAARAQLLAFIGGYGWLLATTVVGLLFFGVCYDMLMAYLSSFFRQRAWNSIDLAAKVLPQLLIVGAILAGWDIMGVLVAMILAPAIAVSLATWQVLRLRRELKATQGEAAPRAALLGDWRRWLPPGFIRYSGVSFMMTATDYFASASFAIFLAGDLGDVALLWAGSSLVAMALGYLYTPMVGVQVPLFTRVRQGEGGTLNGAYQSLVRLQLLLLVPGGVGLMLLAQPALLVINPAYVAAAPVVWVLVPCLFLECLLTTAHNALIVYERLPIIVASRLIIVAAMAALAWALPPLYGGLLGVVMAFGLARVVAGLWVTGSGMRVLGLRWPWRFAARVVGATVAMGAVILATRGLLPPLSADAGLAARVVEALWLMALAAIGAAAFFAALRLLGGLDEQDRAQLDRMKLPLKKWLMQLL